MGMKVSSSRGAGKTSVAAEWARQRRSPSPPSIKDRKLVSNKDLRSSQVVSSNTRKTRRFGSFGILGGHFGQPLELDDIGLIPGFAALLLNTDGARRVFGSVVILPLAEAVDITSPIDAHQL